MYDLDVNSLKVGDEIGFARFHGFGTMLTGGIATIISINGHRHITLSNGRVFDKRGNERVDYGSRLYTIAYIERHRAAETQRRELNETYRRLANLLDGQKTGGGDFTGLTVDIKDAVIALVKRL